MAITDNTAKLLWGRAAGICSNPICRFDLTILIEGNRSFNVGEMAHVIARREGGPRGQTGGGSNEYENLILLCPTCHRLVDKAPVGEYTEEMLYGWKLEHELSIRAFGRNQIFGSIVELKSAVSRLLAENKAIWQHFGPSSDVARLDPGSNLHEVWTLRKLNTIVPNNTKILNIVEANFVLLNTEQSSVFIEFKIHATAFEQHQYQRLDFYPQFPAKFAEVMFI
jgi:hypothetical protein